ncbi:SEL1-like repeat protein [Inquilinus sp. Marseille-Q2685]|uniref:SEL1-like repeat protein n=1 Tax=Inquilinus sp. Marseille-Q2685 TaxID=2866581 RepID=UPI001CE3E8C1|nr:SEL1-like repeat protein [Inquilinus sp. Marseille-Q2685]
MDSLADDVTRLGHEPDNSRGSAARRAVAALLAFTVVGCSTLDELGLGWGSAGSAEAPQASAPDPAAPALQPAPAASAPALRTAAIWPDETGTPRAPDNSAAEAPLPDNASPELRDLARRAMAGDANAEYEIGTRFARGMEVPQSDERAAYWYRRAADQRKADALYALGLVYLNGSGVPRDVREAMNWFRRASIAGNPRGAYEVGRLYESGELGPPNPRIAAGWYRIAADGGDEQGKQALARLQASPGVAASAMPGTGVASPDAGRLAPAQATTAATSAEPGLDNPAAQVPAPEPTSRQAAIASPSAVPATPPALAPDRPATGAQIREIQQLLGRLNLDAGQANGRLGRRTRAAIATFQRSQGLPVTGQPSAALLQALRTAAEPPRFD